MKFNLVLLFAMTVSLAFSQENFRTSNFTMSIKGSSNLHDWESQVKDVRVNASITIDAEGLKSLQALSVDIPVKSIKSPKGNIMDNKTHDALKADKFPTISYKLEKATVNKKGDSYDINATGYLTMAGTTNKIEMYVHGKTASDGTVTFSGSKKLKMTDYKIKPPTALLGTLTTGDDVEILFQITLKKI